MVKMELRLFIFGAVFFTSYFEEANTKVLNDETTTLNNETTTAEERSPISIWFPDFQKWLKKNGMNIAKCEKAKKNGEKISAADAPLKNFGQPSFKYSAQGSSINLFPGVMLTWKQPIKIGSRDFVFSGTPEEIMAFCLCYDQYEVIGSELDMATGAFKSGTGQIKIQMQDTAAWDGGKNANALDMIIKYTLERITKFINPMSVMDKMDTEIFGADSDYTKAIKKVRQGFEKIRKWIPLIPKAVDKIKEILGKNLSKKEMVKELVTYITSLSPEQKKWIGLDKEQIKGKRKVIVVLTMYPTPDNGIRVTYNTGKPRVKFADIGKAIKAAFDYLHVL